MPAQNRRIASLAIALLVVPALAAAGGEKYVVDPVHSDVGFTVKHLVAKVPGRFDVFEGEILVDPNDPSTMSITGKVQVGSINTHNEKRDGHLKSADFFDAENHPEMAFKSKAVQRKGERYIVTGALTLRGVTKDVAFEVEILGFAPGGSHLGLEARSRINRKDFGVSWNKALDQGGFVLGDEVDIVVHVEAKRDMPKTKS